MPSFGVPRLRHFDRHHMRVRENPVHAHEYDEAVLYLRGRGLVVADGRAIPFTRGTLVCCASGVPHLERSSAPYQSLSLAFTGSRHGARVRMGQDGPGEPLLHLVSLLELEYRRKGPHWERLCDEGLSLLLTWLEARGESPQENPWVARVEDLLLAGLPEPGFRLLESLAKLGPSPSHLIRLFTKARGRSPLQHLLQLRIREAEHLLTVTQMPVHEVARRVGFDDPYYFSRAFRKISGKAPSLVRA
ncbi:MAG: helix-turn-helix domain-containing protein [Spirochaetes bacterium]|nr:helix-turn-helix domain-containing protein [Spirochaetota bacterium]